MLDRLLPLLLRSAAIVSAGLLLFIIGFIGASAWPALHDPGPTAFLGDAHWNHVDERFGIWQLLLTSLVIAAGALLVAAPTGVCLALWSHWYAPGWLGTLMRNLVDFAAGIPSVIIALWGMLVLVPAFAALSPTGQGQGPLAGMLLLALVIVPIATVAADQAIAAVPAQVVAGAHALGLSRSAICWGVVVPAARHGLAVGTILQASRAIGETMVVLMVSGNLVAWPTEPFRSVRALTAHIALEMGEAQGSHQASLFAAGLLLLLVVLALVLLSEWLLARRQHASG